MQSAAGNEDTHSLLLLTEQIPAARDWGGGPFFRFVFLYIEGSTQNTAESRGKEGTTEALKPVAGSRTRRGIQYLFPQHFSSGWGDRAGNRVVCCSPETISNTI